MAGKPRTNDKRNRERRAEYAKEKLHERLALFEDLESTVLPKLMKLLAEGADSQRMREEMAPLLTARQLSMALTSKDEGKALAAITDAINRVEGKPKETIDTTHRLEKLPEEELNAILLSKLRGASSEPVEDESEKH